MTNLGVATAFDFATKLKSRTESDIAVSSFYIQDQIEVSDKVLLMLGGRMDTFDITVDDSILCNLEFFFQLEDLLLQEWTYYY